MIGAFRRRASAAATRHRSLIRSASWVGALAPIALVVASVAAAGSGSSSSCVLEAPPADGSTPVVSKGAVLKRDSEGFRLHFGDARDTRADLVVLPFERGELEPGDRAYPSMSEPLRSSDWTILPARDSAGNTSPSWGSHITQTGVEVCIEIDASLIDAHPGRYAGSIGVVGPDLDVGSTVPVEVTFRSSRFLAVAIAFAGVLLGLLVKMFTELAAANRSSQVTGVPRTAPEYLKDWSFRAAIILGAIAGALGYVEIYAVDPTWGTSPTDWLKLFGTCFAFQLAGIGGVDLARRLMGDPS